MTAVLYAPSSGDIRRVATQGGADPRLRPGRSTRMAGAVAAALLIVAACALGLVLSSGHAGASTAAAVMENYAFQPASMTVSVGDTVTWTNLDDAPHTVTTLSGPARISSPTLNKGDKFSYKFTVAGVYKIYCAIHPNMTQTVTVVGPASTSSPGMGSSSTSSGPGPAGSASSGSMPGMGGGSSMGAGGSSSMSGSPPSGASTSAAASPGSSPGSTSGSGSTSCSNTMLVNAMLNPFIIHLDKAHLEETPGQQVQGLLDPNTYVQLHTVMLEDMLMPAITAIQNSLNGIDPLITHIDKAHLEETPGQQVNQLLNTDSYVQLHTVMVEDMINPLTQSLTGTYGC